MQGTITYFKGSDGGFGYIESKGHHYFFRARDVVFGCNRVRVGVDVEFEQKPSLSSHVTPRAQSVMVLLEPSDAS
jgi:hypothetical protein